MNKMIKLVSISSFLVFSLDLLAGISGDDVKTEKVLVSLNKSKLITLEELAKLSY